MSAPKEICKSRYTNVRIIIIIIIIIIENYHSAERNMQHVQDHSVK